MSNNELRARIELIKKRQKAATSSTGTKALLIQTFSEDLPWLIEQAERVADAEAALAKCEADKAGLLYDTERYHLMCNTLWEKVTATGDEDCARIAVNRITELEHKLAECEREKEQFKTLAVEMALPYEALLMDAPLRKWLSPEIWSAIETAVTKVRAALTEAGEGEK